MNVKKCLEQVTDLADELLTTIDDESWDEAVVLSQQWDSRVRNFIKSVIADQSVSVKSEIKNIALQNARIENRLTELRAKVLTQIQENNTSRSAIQLYNNTV